MDKNDKEELRQVLNQVGNQDTPLVGNSNVELMYRLINPQTIGFNHVNLDMAFTKLSIWDRERVLKLSRIADICKLFNWKKSYYLARGELAALLNSNKSLDGWSGTLLTNTVTQQKIETYQKSDKVRTGFKFGNFGKVIKED